MPESAPQLVRFPAYAGSEPFVFVSYSHADEELVQQEAARLVGRGIRINYDEGIRPGHSWHADIANAIETSTLFLIFLTRNSIASQNCQRELAFALENGRSILPVLLEDVELPSTIRLQIGDRQAIIRSRFTEAEFRERLTEAVLSFVGSSRGLIDDAPSKKTPPRHAARGRPQPMILAALVVSAGLLAAYVGYLVWEHRGSARAQNLAEISKLVAQDQYSAAFALARPLMESSGSDDALRKLWQQIVVPMTPLVSEADAVVYFKPYADVDGTWIKAGMTPFTSPVDAPRGVLRLKVEKAGFRTGYFAVANPGPSLQSVEELSRDVFPDTASVVFPNVPLKLAAEGSLAEDLVLVPHTNLPVFLSGWTADWIGSHQLDIPDFAIARTEVTNHAFKDFVDADGYNNPAYWQGLEFIDGGRELSFEEARTRFVDRTGQPGPSGWELGAFTTGAGDLPVRGISWYEAVAYARFRGQLLPTIHHWLRAAFAPVDGAYPTAAMVADSSQFLADGPARASEQRGLGPWGTFNTAGNVREWVWNFAGDKALALGGSWQEYPGTYTMAYKAEPMARPADCGLRLMYPLSDAPLSPELLDPIQLSDLAITQREPVSDETFTGMRFQYTDMHRKPASVAIERAAETDTWVADEVTLKFADGAPFTLYVLRPPQQRGKLQPIIYGPAGDALQSAQPNRSALAHLRNIDFVVGGRRALVVPIWARSFERFEPMPLDLGARTERFRRTTVEWYHDLVTTIDYLSTREDVDIGQLGFVGFSMGAAYMAPPLFAIEGRLKAGVLISGGTFNAFPVHPMLDAINYAPHIVAPILMINGRYDTVFPFETSQKRFFELLGTPDSDKRLVVYDSAHVVWLGNKGKREVSDWFDHYLGVAR